MDFFGELDKYFDLIPQNELLFTLFGNWMKNSYPYKEMIEEVEGIAKTLRVNFGKVMLL